MSISVFPAPGIAYASNHAGTQFSGTNVSGTIDSVGITLSAAAGAGGGAAIQGSGTYTQNTGTIQFSNSNGVTFGLSNNGIMTASHNALTTGMASNRGSDFVQATAAFAGTNASGTIASNGISVSVGDYITTAMASNRGSDFVQATAAFAGTNASGTIASNGISVSVGNYITTAALSNHSHGNPQLNLTNLSGTTASNSAGFTLSLSAAAPGGGGGVALSAGTQSVSTGTMNFANSNGITFGMSNSNQITASHNGLTTAAQSDHSHGNPTLNLTNLSGTTASNSAGFTLSLSAAAPGGGAARSQYWAVPNLFPGPMGLMTNLTGTAVSHRLLLFPFQVEGDLTCQELMWYMSRAASGSDLFTLSHGIFSFVNSSSIGLVSSASGVYSNTATAGNSGIRIWEAFPAATTLSKGDYVLGMHFSGAATASMNFSLMGYSTSNLNVLGVVHTGTNNTLTHLSHQLIPFWGRYSVTTNAFPSGVNMTGVHGRGTNALPLYFWLGTHN